MWKNSLCIGVDVIDRQHEALYGALEGMLVEFCDNGTMPEQQYKSFFSSFNENILRHFVDEEDYLQSIGFRGLDAHKKHHSKFIKMLLNNEKKMNEPKYCVKSAKFFMGSLVTWFLFHVADTDKQFTFRAEESARQADSYADLVFYKIHNVFNTLAGINAKRVETHDETFSKIVNIFIGLGGDMSGYVSMAYPTFLVDELVFAALDYRPLISDEVVMSSVLEMTQIISNLLAEHISREKGVSLEAGIPGCAQRYDTPAPGSDRLTVDTGMGVIEVEISVSPISSEEAFRNLPAEKQKEFMDS